MGADVYNTPAWRAARASALARDGHRCSAGRLLGGACSELLHVHHLIPVRAGGAPYNPDNLLTLCDRHHPVVEAVRKAVLRYRREQGPRCRHQHRSVEARLLCEARLSRRRMAA